MARKDSIKVCLVGTGRAGMVHAKNFVKNVPNAGLVALVDPVANALEAAALELGVGQRYLHYADALDQCEFDAIVVAAPTQYHKEIVVAAANAGKHILCEKPLAVNEADCDEMVEAAAFNKVILQVGFMRRFDQSFLAAKERIDTGEIGDVVMVRSLTYGPSIPKPWMYDISQSNGPLAEVNSHDIDTLRWFTGSEFKQVHALAGNFRCPDARDTFPDFYDNVILNASFENGMQGSISGAQGVRYGYDSRCEILGREGIIFVGALDHGTMVSCNRSGKSQSIVKSWTDLYEDAYLQEDKHFIECIIEEKEPRATGYDGKMAVAVVSAGNRSIKENRAIMVNDETILTRR